MARDYGAIEAEFIADLKSRSGRDLEAWMTAIARTGLTDRDHIIDWLQPQGFTFSHASWLERIHNNGGRPIYSGQPPDRRPDRRPDAGPLPTPRGATDARPAVATPVARTAAVAPAQPAARPAPAATPSDDDALGALLARGKAYRMLAELVIAEARRALPAANVAARGDAVAIEGPGLIAVMHVTPREIRLGLALGDAAVAPPFVRPKGIGGGAAITHMLVLNDARQVDDTLVELLRRADRVANPQP